MGDEGEDVDLDAVVDPHLMNDTPSFLRPEVAATFDDRAVAASYRCRPSYPPQTFDLLRVLIADEPRTVLDLGCGTGFLARPLAPAVDQVDAVDASAAMIEEGKRLPGGTHPHLRWIVGRAEDVVLQPPYALVVAGDSLHWMDWEVVLPRLANVLSPTGSLALLTVDGQLATKDQVVQEALLALIRRYTTFNEWRPDFDLVADLHRRGLFCEEGRTRTEEMLVHQSVGAYIESFHARASLSWGRMDPDAAVLFDAELRDLLLERVGNVVELEVQAAIWWGKPRRP